MAGDKFEKAVKHSGERKNGGFPFEMDDLALVKISDSNGDDAYVEAQIRFIHHTHQVVYVEDSNDVLMKAPFSAVVSLNADVEGAHLQSFPDQEEGWPELGITPVDPNLPRITRSARQSLEQ